MDPEKLAAMLALFMSPPDPNDDPGGGGSGGNDDPPADDDPSGGGGPTTQPQGFSQEDIDAIVEKRLARERQKYESQLSELGFESFDDIKELKEREKKRRREELEKKEKYKQLLEETQQEKDQQISELQQQLNQIQNNYHRERAQRRLIEAANEAGALKPRQIARLLEDRIRLEDGRVQVVGEDGSPRITKSGDDMTPEELVVEFLNENDHFKRAAGGRGAGGGPNGNPGGSGKKPKGFDPAKKSDPDHLIENLDEVLEKARKGEIKVF